MILGLTKDEVRELAHFEYDVKHAPWCRDDNRSRAYRCTCDFFKAIEYNVWKILGMHMLPNPMEYLAWKHFGNAFDPQPPQYVALAPIIGRLTCRAATL